MKTWHYKTKYLPPHSGRGVASDCRAHARARGRRRGAARGLEVLGAGQGLRVGPRRARGQGLGAVARHAVADGVKVSVQNGLGAAGAVRAEGAALVPLHAVQLHGQAAARERTVLLESPRRPKRVVYQGAFYVALAQCSVLFCFYFLSGQRRRG